MLLWDESNQVLFAARDRFGIKPLFYAFHQGRLYFASEVKALFAAGVPARWNRDAISRGASGGGHPAQTLFDGVFQVLPGHYLLATRGGTHVHRYWDFDYPRADGGTRAVDDAENAERLRDVLDEAVRLRLRADVPVGCYLSGGLDSCSVIGLASKHLSHPIRAFTLTFDSPDYDESVIAREMAALSGAEYYPVPIRQDDLADHFADATWHSETLCFNAHGVAKYVLSRAVRDAGYKVVLTGEGSDEIFGGYPHFRRDMLLYDNGGQDPAAVRDLLAQLERANPVSRGLLLPDGEAVSTEGVRRTLGFTPSWIEATSAALFKMRGLQSAAVQAEFSDRDSYRGLLNSLDVPGRLAGRAPVHQSLYLWSKTILATYILVVLGDRMEMAHSVEGRVPFLDHKVVELVVSLPVSAKIRGMNEKFVLREAARPVLTDTVYRRQKHPFLSPPATLEREGEAEPVHAGHAARSGPGFDGILRPGESDAAARRASGDERRGAHGPGSGPHADPERLRAPRTLRPRGVRVSCSHSTGVSLTYAFFTPSVSPWGTSAPALRTTLRKCCLPGIWAPATGAAARGITSEIRWRG